MAKQNYTIAVTCHWCKGPGPVKYLKVSLKKAKPACLGCYDMMTMHLKEIKIEVDELPPFLGRRRLW